jgi:hypothetical protein
MAIETTRIALGPRFNEGARLLWQVLLERQWSQGDMARAIGAKPGVVPRWLYGDTRPSWEWAARLLDVCGIPLAAQTSAPTIAFVLPAASGDLLSDARTNGGEVFIVAFAITLKGDRMLWLLKNGIPNVQRIEFITGIPSFHQRDWKSATWRAAAKATSGLT